jgi:NADPH-dependent F420 reductase
MKIACIGSGNVGYALADRFVRVGHDVVIGARDSSSASVKAAVGKNSRLKVDSLREAVQGAEVIVLAVPFNSLVSAVQGLEASLAGKIVVDCTNPVGPGITHALESDTSGTEQLAKLLPQSHVVKAFSIYGFENFSSTSYPAYDVKPAMLLCGEDAAAKLVVTDLCSQLGWEPVDVGGIDQALHLEHMALLWIKMARVAGKGPDFVWAMLRR